MNNDKVLKALRENRVSFNKNFSEISKNQQDIADLLSKILKKLDDK